MNKRVNAKSRKWLMIAGALCVSLVIGGAFAFASEALLSPSATQVTAGSGLSFKVNLGDVKKQYEGTEEQFTLTVNISPSPESVSVSPDVAISQYGSKYTVNSADLTDISALTFTVYPGSNITATTTYTVTADVSGKHTASDSFTFTAVPKQEEKKQEEKKQEATTDDNKKKSSPNKNSAGGGGTAAASGGSSSDSSTVYKGSADNYLSKLAVDGYDFTQKFNSTRDTYFIEVPEDVESVDVSATAHDSSAAVRIAGSSNISEKNNKIMVNVTADNGDVRVYRIYVTRKAEDK